MCSIPGLPLPGSNVSVLITRVNLNPLCVLVEFWGNFDQDRKLAYQQMKKEIQCPKEAFHEAEGSPGDLCLVQVYETWYRARIVSKNYTEYSVFLIDEGRTLRATTSTLAWGQTEFFYLPPEVEFCVLANVLPLSAENRWSPTALEYLRTFSGRTVSAFIQDVVVPQRTFLLDIPCLSKQMYEMGFSKKLSNERFRDFVTRSLQYHYHNDSAETPRTSTVELAGPKQKHMCYMYPELQAETVETVIVTEVTSPLRVFCQLKVFSQELQKLTEQITRHCEGRVGHLFSTSENLGAPCASKGSDGRWYRSVLQQVMPSTSMAEVLHVDYGKKQLVLVNHVRPLALEFFRMPVVTYVCSLHGIIDRGVGWTASQIDYLKSLLLNRTVIAKFEYQSLSEGVHYVTLYGDENTNINNLFGFKEKCLIHSKTKVDCAVEKSASSQKFQIVASENKPFQKSTDSVNLKTNQPVIFTESLSPKTSHVAVVQHVDSPSKFWIQTQRFADEFNQLMDSLGELYSDNFCAEGLIRKPVAGLLCVAKSQDDVFYRAIICQVVEAKAEVFFLDYGNTEVVDCFNLRELPLRYHKLPALAVKCAIYGIQPVYKLWDEKATLFFSKAVHDKVLEVHVIAKSQDTHVVQIIDPASDGEKDVSKLLCSAGFADSEVQKKAMEKFIVKPCTKMGQTSDMFTTNACQSFYSPAATDTRSAFKEYLFPIGSLVDVNVSHIESPNDFWCQKLTNKECLRLLMEDLQDYYTDSEYHPLSEAACVARHPQNGMWYRALVIQKFQSPHVTVLFIDYGQTMKVGICDLRCIHPTFLTLKGQAFRCSLYNLIHPVSHSTLDWSPDATLQFQEFVNTATSMNMVLKCTVYAVMYNAQKVAFNVVDLETPFQSICSLLVQKGLADRAQSIKTPLPPFRLDTYYYSTHNIKTGSEEEVSITSVNNINTFFCQLQRNYVEIEELAEKLNKLCNQLAKIDYPKTFGKVCFAKYTDGLWYRGQIKSTHPSVVVHFVDYGNTEEVKNTDLLPVPFEASELMSVPVQAIECGLSDMPENVPEEVNSWFENFVIDHSLKALVVAKDSCGKLMIELYDGKTQVNAMIREKFHIGVDKNDQVTFRGFQFKDRKSQNVPDNVADNSSSERLHESHRFQRAKVQHQSTRALDNNRLGPAERVKCQDGEKQRDLSQMSNQPGHYESAKFSDVKQAKLPLKMVKPGLEAEVFISHCIGPNSFFVQFVSDENEIFSLVEKLNECQSKCLPINPRDLHEGDLVSAIFPDDNCWYRAEVRKKCEDDMIEVEFIDFGNTAEISVSKICILDKIFFSSPRYSIHCSLSGLVNVDKQASFDFKNEIEKSNKVTCTFNKQSGFLWEVKLGAGGNQLGSTFCKHTNAVNATGDAFQSPFRNDISNVSLSAYYKNPDIYCGQSIMAYASFISGPQLFWCQFAEAEKLREISDVIQKAGSKLGARELKEESLHVGSACIALFPEDQLWYRAKVISRDDNTLSILFVDYGNESKVAMSEVRPLPLDVSDFVPQAFPCKLDGFSVSEGSWTDKADDEFFELITDKLLKVTILKLGSSDSVGAPHFVRMECEELVINDIMNNYWNPKSKVSSLELAGAPFEASIGSDMIAEVAPSECVAESNTSNKESFQTATEPLEMNVISTLKENAEIEHHGTDVWQKKQAEPISSQDKGHDDMDIVNLECVDPKNYEQGFVGTSEISTGLENAGSDQEKAVLRDSDVKAIPDISPSQTADVRTCLPEHTGSISEEALKTSQSPQPDLSESPESVELEKPLEDTLSQKDQSSDLYSSVSKHEKGTEDSCEIIKSGLGYLRRAVERSPVGSECVIWSHAHKNWCQAQILKICEDSTLVLLLDHDLEMVVDPGNIFEIVPKEQFQNQCGDDTGCSGDILERLSPSGYLDPEIKAKEMELNARARFASPEPFEMCEEPCAVKGLVTVNQKPQDKECVSRSGYLVGESERSLHENMNKGTESENGTPGEVTEMVTANISVEQQEPDPVRNSFIDQARTEDAEERGFYQRERNPEASDQTDNLIDFLLPTQLDQDVEPNAESGCEGLIDEINSFSEDLIDLTSDGELDSDTASDDTLHADPVVAEPFSPRTESSGSNENPSTFEHPDLEMELSRITHLTLKVEDMSDEDIIFVKEWQVSLTEVNEPCSED